MSAIPPINPPIGSNFSCPYMCSSSGGLRDIRVVKKSINVVRASSSACKPSLTIAKLPAAKPMETSTKITLDIAIAESLSVLSL
jgi:hypothetical protein